MGVSFAGYIGVGIIASAVFVMVAFLLMVRYATKLGNQPTYKSIPNRTNPPQTHLTYKRPQATTVSSYNNFYDSNQTYQPTVLYHGTSKKNAFDIYYTGAWLIGNSRPPAVWMADTIELAKIYSSFGSNGAIVVIHVDLDLEIESRGGGVFIYQIPGALPNQEYYKIEGLVPREILDNNGNKIR
jgi:hypothetical protein